MSAEGFSIHPAELHAAADVFAAEGIRLQQAAAAWHAEVARIGDCFGNDEAGVKMKADYDPVKDAIVNAVAALAEGVPSTSPALRVAADNTVDRDQSNASAF